MAALLILPPRTLLGERHTQGSEEFDKVLS